MMSRLVLTADPRPRYSHVGIVVIHDGMVRVVHAQPGDGERSGGTISESWASFTGEDEASGFGLYRLQPDLESRAAEAARQAEKFATAAIPFDSDFDLTSADRLYCTELVWRSFAAAGVDLSRGQRVRLHVPFLQKEVIVPGTFLGNGLLVLVGEYDYTSGDTK